MLKKYLHFTLFIMLFTSSLMAVEFSGFSINKIGMIPFMIGAFAALLRNGRVSISPKERIYILFLLASCISATIGLIHPIIRIDDLPQTFVKYLLQVFFLYIPLVLFVSGNLGNKYELQDSFSTQIIYIARIHALFIIVQFIFYIALGINISSIIFDDVFRGITNVNWNSFVYGSTKVIRASGLNRDPAFASYIMMCGFVFDKSKVFRWLYIICPILAQSRTGFVVLIILAMLTVFQDEKKRKRIRELMPRLMGTFVGLIIVLLSMRWNEALSKQMDSIIERILDLFNTSGRDISTIRHLFYPKWAIKTWASFGDIFYWIFGIGPRTSGLAFIRNISITSNYLSANMRNSIWAVECDFAELLLGYGLLGLGIYYYFLFTLTRDKKREVKLAGIAMIIMSIMYDYSSITFNVIIIAFMILLSRREAFSDD